ncbi:hypothetical protein BH24ACT3_BH24ACT3_12950 [soil metagenome]
MSTLGFLLVPLLVSVIVTTFLYLRARQPTSVESGVDDFSREMRALAPDGRASDSGVADSGVADNRVADNRVAGGGATGDGRRRATPPGSR